MKTSAILLLFSFFFIGTSLNAQSWTEKASDSEVRVSVDIVNCNGYGAVLVRAENISGQVISKQLTVSVNMNGKTSERPMIVADLQPGEVVTGDCCSTSSGGSNAKCVIFNENMPVTADDVTVSLN